MKRPRIKLNRSAWPTIFDSSTETGGSTVGKVGVDLTDVPDGWNNQDTYPISSEFFIDVHRDAFWDAFTKKLLDNPQQVMGK